MFDYSYENLKRIAQTEKGKQIVEQAKEIYEKEYANKPILALNYSYQKLFIIDGNRNKFEAMYFERRKRLRLLQVLALADDAYIENLEEILAAITDEFTWVLPAHAYGPNQQGYDYRYRLDLFSTETSFYLSETVYVFGDKLSMDIRNRVKLAVEDKIVRIYEYEPGKLFHSFEHYADNWAAVCTCGIGLSYLYLFPERFNLLEERILKNLELYLSSIDEEGYCDEGIGYWQYGFGFFCLFFDVYVQLTGKSPAFLKTQKMKNLVQYMQRAQMNGGVYLPFADGGTKRFLSDCQIFCAIKNLFGDLFGVDLSSNIKIDESSKALALRLLNGVDKFTSGMSVVKKEQLTETFYYSNAQVFIHKNDNYAFAAKSGYNREKHNHNDVGSFQIVKGEKRLICDIGAGDYTRQYFDENERYKFFVCSSLGHSVPIVGGKAQRFGKEYYGKVLQHTNNLFQIDIASAYEDGVDSLVVTYEVQEEGVRVHYAVKGLTDTITFRFVSDFAPIVEQGGKIVRIEDLLEIISKQKLLPSIEHKTYNLHTRASKVIEIIKGNKVVISNEADAWVIDYTMNGADVEAEFYFKMEN